MVRRKRIDLTKRFYLMVFRCSPPSQFWEAEFPQIKGGRSVVEIEENNNEIRDVDAREKIFIYLSMLTGHEMRMSYDGVRMGQFPRLSD